MDRMMARLRAKASCCSDREVAILASAMEEAIQYKHVDPFKQLMVIQVATWLLWWCFALASHLFEIIFSCLWFYLVGIPVPHIRNQNE